MLLHSVPWSMLEFVFVRYFFFFSFHNNCD